jgi:chromatin segregation and condensation protein Rec8/ScpA/Scc1 (kleisin family)
MTGSLTAYLRERRAALPDADLEAGGEFLVWSAETIRERTAQLLPPPPLETALASPPPAEKGPAWNRSQLAEAAAALLERQRGGSNAILTVSREPDAPAPLDDEPTLNLLDVLRLARQALETARAHRELDVSPASVTVEEMIRWIDAELTAGGVLDADAALSSQVSAERAVALFLAILELGREAEIRIEQEGLFAPIRLYRNGPTVP